MIRRHVPSLVLGAALLTALVPAGAVSAASLPAAAAPTASQTAVQPAAPNPAGLLRVTGARGAAVADAADVAPTGEADVSVVEVDVVVPPVTPESGVQVTPELLEAAADPATIVTDEVAPGAERVESAVVEADEFQTLGVTWPADETVGDLGAQVRTRSGDEWSEWVALEQADDGPDPGTPDARGDVRDGTDPLWVGDADAVQLSFAAGAEGGPDGMSLVLIGSEEIPASTGSGGGSVPAQGGASGDAATSLTAGPVATAVQPRVISRAEWGARAQVCTPDTARTLVGVVLHHTAGPNEYSSVAEAMQQIRNDQRYHIEGRGWCDIGYNFIVDKWGNIYEGRADSLTKPVIGVHAGGFNTGTVGISMLGSYGTVNPAPAVQESVAQIAAWRLREYHRDPAGSHVYHTLGGENSKYPAGTNVTLPVVFAHRDVGNTACPGNAGYATLPHVRNRARQLAGPSLVNPAVSPTSAVGGSNFTLRSATVGSVNWRLDVLDARTGVGVATEIGFGQEALGGVVATWNGRNRSGQPAGTGPYRMTLSGTGTNGERVPPFSVTVQVTGSQNPPTVAPVPLTGDLKFVPVTPTRILDTRPTVQSLGPASRVDVRVTGVAGIPADAKAVAINVTTAHSSAVTHVRAWPAGRPMPSASVLNADAARSASAAGVVLGVGGEGKISLYNNAGSTHLLVDVTGYYTATGGSGYGQLGTAARVLDTRSTGGAMGGGQRRTVSVANVGGVPADATAVVMNVTSVASTGDGYVAVVPSGVTPTVSSVNHLPTQDVSNRTTVPLSGGKVDVLVAGGSAHVVLDVVGWFGPGATSAFTPVAPVRAFDTRDSGSIGQGETRTLQVRSTANLPSDARSAVMTVTAVGQTAPITYLTGWPAGGARPGTSDLNTGRGRDQANSAVIGLGAAGAIQIYNNAGRTHAVGDVYGYYR